MFRNLTMKIDSNETHRTGLRKQNGGAPEGSGKWGGGSSKVVERTNKEAKKGRGKAPNAIKFYGLEPA